MSAPKIATFYGPRQYAPRPHIVFPTDRTAALTLAGRLDRLADQQLAEGRFGQAERLSHAALELKCRATGCRA